ncbi:MAG: hypothetical protein ACM3WU_05125 [Bacillota bacterium]
MPDNITMLQVADVFAGALMALIGQPVVVYLMHVSAESLEGVPMPPKGPYEPCPPYPAPPPTPAPVAGGPSITGGTPIIPGAPGPTGNVGPIMGSPIGSASLWGMPEPCPPHEMGTGVVAGTLGFVGADYIIIRVPCRGVCIDLLVPFNAIGMIVVGYLA